MKGFSADEGLAAAVRNFLACLPRPVFYCRDRSPLRLHRIVSPRIAVSIVTLDRPWPASLVGLESIAERERSNIIGLSRDGATSERLCFDLVLHRHMRSRVFANYAFQKAAGGGLFTPVTSGLLVRLDARGLTAGDEAYLVTPCGQLAAIDRAASERMTPVIESLYSSPRPPDLDRWRLQADPLQHDSLDDHDT